MRKVVICVILLCWMMNLAMAQETSKAEKREPVRSPYESGILLDNQTCVIYPANTLEFLLEHRFGPMKYGMEDLFGIWAPANIYLGLNYSITDYLIVGAGTAKTNRLQDIHWKWDILKQSRSGSIPVFVTYYGDIAMDARNKSVFGDNYKFADRLSYLTEIIVTRKFYDRLTLQVSGSFSHINKVPEGQDHDKIGLSFGGRFRVSPQSSIIVCYDLPINTKAITENIPLPASMPNFSIAWEIATAAHDFQIMLGTANYLNRQYNMIYNNVDWTDWSHGSPLMLGLNLTRLWSF